MRRNRLKENMLLISLTISLLINLKQCSVSQTFNDETSALEHEILELQLSIERNRKAVDKFEANKPVVKIEPEAKKKFKPRVVIDSIVKPAIDSIPEVVFDSVKIK